MRTKNEPPGNEKTGEGTKDKYACNSEFTQKKTTDLRKKEEIIKEKSRPKQKFFSFR